MYFKNKYLSKLFRMNSLQTESLKFNFLKKYPKEFGIGTDP